MNRSPENMMMMPAATKRGLIVGSGIGMPSSFAVRRSVSRCTGFASASFSCSVHPPCVCGISDVRSGCVRSHNGYRDSTSGISAKLYSGGGDGIDHSSVAASHGLSGAMGPLDLLRKKFHTKIEVDSTSMNAPMDEIMLNVSQPWP